MPPDIFLHEHPEFTELIRIIAAEKDILPQLIEKDYWIMHCLYGLTIQGFQFELKGGTSLSKGFNLIQRFSEDIDIKIDPSIAKELDVKTGANQNKPAHVESRRKFYDWLSGKISVPGIVQVVRDHEFDDEKYRSGGIRLTYHSHFDPTTGLKSGILLEVGFDATTPNESVTISSWAYDYALGAGLPLIDNRAVDIRCYHPGYTFVEKLQTISTKFRKQQESGKFPDNFLRHYYDISCLLDSEVVQQFIGTPEYNAWKKERFRTQDNQNIAENEAFRFSNPETRQLYEATYVNSGGIYYQGQIPFTTIIDKISRHITRL